MLVENVDLVGGCKGDVCTWCGETLCGTLETRTNGISEVAATLRERGCGTCDAVVLFDGQFPVVR